MGTVVLLSKESKEQNPCGLPFYENYEVIDFEEITLGTTWTEQNKISLFTKFLQRHI